MSCSAKLSHTVGKLWLFSLESFRRGRHCAVIPHAEKLPVTAPVGTVENARSARERVTDAPPGIYAGAVLLSYYLRALGAHSELYYSRLSACVCLFVSDAASGTLRSARCRVQPFLFVKHRQVGMTTSFIEAYAR